MAEEEGQRRKQRPRFSLPDSWQLFTKTDVDKSGSIEFGELAGCVNDPCVLHRQLCPMDCKAVLHDAPQSRALPRLHGFAQDGLFELIDEDQDGCITLQELRPCDAPDGGVPRGCEGRDTSSPAGPTSHR